MGLSPHTPARPRRALLAWEMGEGFGHAERLLFLAAWLRQRGWQTKVYARNPAALAERYTHAGIEVRQAPPHIPCHDGSKPFAAASFSDIMGICGYAQREALRSTVSAWAGELKAFCPDVVLADYSPLLALAAFGQYPVITLGDGFVVPPATTAGEFPALDRSAAPVWPGAQLLEHAQAIQRERGAPIPERLTDIIEGQAQIVSVPPDLDIYRSERRAVATGPWQVQPPLAKPAGLGRLFLYLRLGHRPTLPLLKLIVEHRLAASCFIHGLTPALRDWLTQAGIVVHREPPDLRHALSETTFFVHHGGIGSLMLAAYAGRPQLLLPRHLEQKLNAATALARLPGTYVMPERISDAAMANALPELFSRERAMITAQASARRLFQQGSTSLQVLDAHLSRLGY